MRKGVSLISEPKTYPELIDLCMNQHPTILNDFRQFLLRNGDAEWLIVSDYHMEKSSSYENFVSVFTILPAGEHYTSRTTVDAGLPTKLSQTPVTDSDIAFLKQLNHYTFVFVSDKKFRPAASSKEAARSSIELSLQNMLNWENAAECSETIGQFKQLREKAKSNSFNLKVFNQATLSASYVSSIALTISRTLSRTIILYWLSDRDEIITKFDGIVYSMLKVNMLAFAEMHQLKPIHLSWFDESDKVIPGEKMEPLALAPFVRIPDYFAAPLAASITNYEGLQVFDKEKCQRILAHVIADSPNFSLLRLANQPGWRFKQITISLTA